MNAHEMTNNCSSLVKEPFHTREPPRQDLCACGSRQGFALNDQGVGSRINSRFSAIMHNLLLVVVPEIVIT